MSCCRWEGDKLHIAVRVQPRSASDEVVGIVGEEIRVKLTSPPVGGEANRSLVRLVAREFRVPKALVRITGGEKGRSKRVAITAPRVLPEWLPAPD